MCRARPKVSTLRLIGVATPKTVVPSDWTFRKPRDDHIHKTVVPDRQRIGDPMRRDHQEKHQQVLRVYEDQHHHAELDNEQCEGNAEHHGRSGQTAHDGIEARLCRLRPHQPPIPLVSEVTTCAAPKIKATPITTEKAHIHGIRLVSARYPTAATATVAAVVANVPVMKDRTSVIAVFRG